MIIYYIAGGGVANNTGMGRIAAQWKLAFERKGHQVVVWDTAMRYGHWHPLWRGLPLLQDLKRVAPPQLLLVHEPLGGWLFSLRLPMVVFSHGLEEKAWQVQQRFQFKKTSAKARLIPDALRFMAHRKGFAAAAGVLVSNKADQAFMAERFSDKPVMLFRNGVFPFERRQSGGNNQIICLWNATWLPRKGTALQVAAFRELLPKYPNLVLRLAGTGCPPESIRMHFPDQVQQQIELLPPHDSHNEASIYEGASVFLLPSFFEGQSLALQQAMFMGLCPVAADNSGQSDIIRHGINGLLFPTGSLSGFIQAIERLLCSPDEVIHLGVAAHETTAQLQWPHVSDEVVDFCECCLNRHR